MGHFLSENVTDLNWRYQTSYIALYNGIISHGAPIVGTRDLADPTRWNKCKQNALVIFAHMHA